MQRFWIIIAAGLIVLSHSPIASAQGASTRPTDQQGVRKVTANAPIALMIDAATGQILYSQGAGRRFIPASITKIMTAYLAFEMLDDGDLRTDQKFSLSPAASKDWYRTGSTMFLEPEEPVSVHMLLRGITAVSANDGSIVLAQGAAGSVRNWTARMNATARDLGMRDSRFGTPNGWPDDARTFTTAADLARLSRAMIDKHPALYARYFGKAGLNYKGFAQANHDPITGTVKGADGIKTGYTRQAGYGFVGSAKRANVRLIMVVAGMDSAGERSITSRQFIEWGFSSFRRTLAYKQGERIGWANVQDGNMDQVEIVAPSDIVLAIPRFGQNELSIKLTYQGPVQAPIKKGTSIAFIDAFDGADRVARIPVVAARNVEQAGFVRRVTNAMSRRFNR